MLRVARSSAVKTRSQATNQLKALLVTGTCRAGRIGDSGRPATDRDALASAPKSPGRYSSRPVTTPTGYAPKPRSPTCAGLLRSRPAADAPTAATDAPTATDSTVAAIVVRTTSSIVVLGRLRYDSRTRAYAAWRTTEGLSKPQII